MIAAGTHATDGSTCRPVRIGPKIARSLLFSPRARPIGVAMMIAMMKPWAARRMLLNVACHRISCSAWFASASHTCRGPGMM